MTIEVEVSPRRDGEIRCVFCREELTGAIETCPGCGATFHPACRAEMPRCATIGCSGVRGAEDSGARRRAARRAPIEDPRERATPERTPDSPPIDRWPHLNRARTPEQFLAWSAAGASIGGLIGMFYAFFESRHGIEGGLAFHACSIGLVLGAAEGAVIGWLGVRREPRFAPSGDSNPTIALLGTLVGLCAAAGEVMGQMLHVPTGIGVVTGLLIVVPLLLRWLGFG